MKLIAKVYLEHGDVSGGVSKPQTIRDSLVEAFRAEDGTPTLAITLRPGTSLSIPLLPPATVYGHRVGEGQLGLRFLKFRQHAWSTAEKTLQVTLTSKDTQALAKLRDCVDKALRFGKSTDQACSSKSQKVINRRPLAARSLNTSAVTMSSGRLGPVAPPKPSATSPMEELPPLSREQQRALDLVVSGRSLFFTGCAGTGKSLLLRHIIRALPAESTFVTGTTGLAASLLGGITINAFAGIGRGEGDLQALARAAGRGESLQRWRRASVLIVDEISMMDGRLFDALEAIARMVRGNDRPFGGIQLILSGDFHQLPPVAKDASSRKFCFEAASWSRCVDASVELTQVFRQADAAFIDMLATVRNGTATTAPLALRAACSRPLNLEDGILATRLFTHRADVDVLNARELSQLPGQEVRFDARDSGDAATLAGACPAPRTLRLKVGAQVMLCKNLNARRGLVNGARGVIEKFSPGGLPVVRWAAGGDPMVVGREVWGVSVGGRHSAQRSQIPLALAWAITVHKSQGLTLDRVEVSLDKAFEPGMAYVALSRARSMDGLRIVGTIAPAALKADPKVLAFYDSLRV